MYVNTWWESEDDFKGWLSSDAFKEAHSGKSKNSEESPVLGNLFFSKRRVEFIEVASYMRFINLIQRGYVDENFISSI